MQENYSTFKVPSFARQETYNFNDTEDYAKIFAELNAISEEIERCRAANS